MQHTDKAELRKPRDILAAMDKDGVRADSNLLTQLNAELSVSLAVQAEEVSLRNLRVASIACLVAVIALGISILQVLRSNTTGETAEIDDIEYQRQVDAYNEQTRITNAQLAQSEAQINRTEKHMERTEVQLSKAEKQTERMEALILKWENQAKAQDNIYDKINNLLKVASEKN